MNPETEQFTFHADLPASLSGALKELLFFHPRQPLYRAAIVASVERHGDPRLAESGGRVRIELPGLPGAQNLYAMLSSGGAAGLVAVAVYYRLEMESLDVIHCASTSSGEARAPAFLAVIGKLLEIGRRVQGVRFLRLPYSTRRIAITTRL